MVACSKSYMNERYNSPALAHCIIMPQKGQKGPKNLTIKVHK